MVRSLIALLLFSTVAGAAPRTLDGEQISNKGEILTLPAGPDALIGATTSATLTGKTLSGASNTITNIDPVAAFGYTPVNKAGDTMTGNLKISRSATGNHFTLERLDAARGRATMAVQGDRTNNSMAGGTFDEINISDSGGTIFASIDSGLFNGPGFFLGSGTDATITKPATNAIAFNTAGSEAGRVNGSGAFYMKSDITAGVAGSSSGALLSCFAGSANTTTLNQAGATESRWTAGGASTATVYTNGNERVKVDSLGDFYIDNLTVSRALVSTTGGKVTTSPVLSSELAFLGGATANIQNQINALNPANAVQKSGDSMTGLLNVPTLSVGDGGALGSELARIKSTIAGSLNLLISNPSASGSAATQITLGSDASNLTCSSFANAAGASLINGCTTSNSKGMQFNSSGGGPINLSQGGIAALKVLGGGQVTLPNLTASRALALDSISGVTTSLATKSELDLLAGVTSSITSRLGGVTSNLSPLNGITGNVLGGFLNGLTGNVQAQLTPLSDVLASVTYFDDFLSLLSGTTFPGQLGWFNDTTGTGSAIPQGIPPTNRPGMWTFSTGTTATGRAVIGLGNNSTTVNSTVLGGGQIQTDWSIALPNTISAGTQEFAVTAGFRDVTNAADPANGVYFRYNVSSANWQCVTRASSVETSNGSGVAIVASGTTYHTLRITVNAAATSVVFAINTGSGFSNVCTNTTNIPTALPIGEGAGIFKTVGTTARTINLDYMKSTHQFTTPRY